MAGGIAVDAVRKHRPNGDHATGDDEYNIPDITFYQPDNRKLKVITIGAGISGIMVAYQLQKHCENIELVVYEKNEEVGGTWFENRYPGCACDIPSHAYTFNFALNPDWPNFFSYAPRIWDYLDKVCNTFDLRKYMHFNTEVIGCYWNEEAGKWTVKLRTTEPGGSTREFDDTCDLLLHGTGILNNFKLPEIPGLDLFEGKVIHTARWPKEYQEEQWKNEKVAVIGSGASSIQTVPTMQPHVKHMDVFVRTAVWFVQVANNYNDNHQYTAEEIATFRNDKKALVAHAKNIEDQINGIFEMFFSGSKEQLAAQDLFRNRMSEFIKDKRLLEGFTPKWALGCRRITPGDPYMKAIQEPNVDVHFTAVNEITKDGLIGADGKGRKVDTIICATGFDVSYRPRFPIIGQNGVDLADKWEVCPEGYMGLGIPDMPNFITFIGPAWPIENGSVMGPLDAVTAYVVKIIKKMQGENIRSLVPRQDITDLFNAHTQEFIKHSVWTEDCRSWYKNNDTGRVNAIWPGSSLHYIQAIREPRYEDYNITYHSKNPWAYLGLGFTKENRTAGMDKSPYLNEELIDPKWLKACLYPGA